MRIRLALALVTAAAALGAGSASAFICNAPINETHGVPGLVTVQVCSEGARIESGPHGLFVTHAGQVGVDVDGRENCVGQRRVTVEPGNPDPTRKIQVDTGGILGTPLEITCP